MSANLTLSGKVAIVTGASRGIGASIAYELAKRGAKVMINYNSPSSEARAEALVARIAALQNGSAAATVRADISLPESPDAIVQATLAAFSTSTIDILVNNAGVELYRPLVELALAEYEHVFNVNIRGVMLMSKAVVPYLRAPGRIVNMSSVGARSGLSGYTVYSATKGAVEGFTRALAVEIGGAGHAVNAVAPGPVQSDMMDTLPKDLIEIQKKRTAMQNRLGTPEDIALIVAWLASEDSQWVTGQTISGTGGCEML
ncbi:hypothetical protein HDZ31DRAFT_81577 [Schizophyllum fasciatum]